MATYDNPIRRTYHLGVVDFDATVGAADTIEVPLDNIGGAGMAGRVVAVYLSEISVAFTDGDTLGGQIQVGDGTDVDKYFDTGELDDVTNLAIGVGVAELLDDGSKVDIERGRSTVTVTCLAATGTGDGTGEVSVEIEWFG